MSKIATYSSYERMKRLVVIDDDPTGCQTIAGIPVFLEWSKETLSEAIAAYETFFILTNSRSLTAKEAKRVSHEVAQNLAFAAGTEYDLTIVSRCDSTLRGHLMAETLPLNEAFGPFDALLFCPAFFEGGRYTFGDIHYLKQTEGLIPAAKTEFARDTIFNYTETNLSQWFEQVSEGQFKANAVISISIETIREGTKSIESILADVTNFCPVIINAVNYSDLNELSCAIVELQRKGKRFLFRSAASLVKVLAGQKGRETYIPPKTGMPGLVIVGSYTDKTTTQLNDLIKKRTIFALVVEPRRIFTDIASEYAIELKNEIDNALGRGLNVCIYTVREYALSGAMESVIEGSKKISDFLYDLIKRLENRPGFMITKGGITSHSIARNGLEIKKALVMGAIVDGVPVWMSGEYSKFPGMPYVVFPGNVGDENTLTEVFDMFV